MIRTGFLGGSWSIFLERDHEGILFVFPKPQTATSWADERDFQGDVSLMGMLGTLEGFRAGV